MPKNPVDTVISADLMVPVIPEQTVLHDHAIAISGGEILDILPRDQAKSRFTADNYFELGDQILIPGLVNAHGHSPMALLRGIADDIPLQEWLEQRIWPLENQFVNREFVNHGASLAIAEMIRGGTTCFADMYFFPDEVARAAENAGIRTQLASPVLDFPTVWAQDADEYINKATALHDEFRNSDLVSTAFGPHAPYTVSDKPLLKIATLAEELDVPIHMHVHETAHEVETGFESTGMRPLQRLQQLGLLSPRLLCVHATQLNDEEIALLSATGASVIHCPESNLKLASGFCRSADLLTANVNLALGTDGCASNNDLDMFSEMRTAALLAKGVSANASAFPAQTALAAATINGAKALGLDTLIGSLEIGKRADIVAIDLAVTSAHPLYNPVSHLVYSAQAGHVSHAWCNGRLLLANGALQSLDESALLQQISSWQQRIANSGALS